MATRYEILKVEKSSAVSETLHLSPRERIVAVCPLGKWSTPLAFGVDIQPHISQEEWHPVDDGLEGGRSFIKVREGAYSIVADFNHPLSDLTDDDIRFVLLDSRAIEVPANEEHRILVCLKVGES